MPEDWKGCLTRVLRRMALSCGGGWEGIIFIVGNNSVIGSACLELDN